MSIPPVSAVSVHGLPFACASRLQILQWINTRLQTGRQTGTVIFTPNAYIGSMADKSPAIKALLLQADLLLPDGIGVCLAARREGKTLERLPGIEVGESVMALACGRRLTVFFLGGEGGVWQKARERFPSCTVYGFPGYFAPHSSEEREVIEAIRQSGAAICFVCLGFPRQESFILRAKPVLPQVSLWMGLGGSLDVWAGKAHRAPKALQKAGMEWAWRMLCDPSKIRRLPSMLSYIGKKEPKK